MSSGTVQLGIGALVEMALPNKITPEWIYNANTKGPKSETRGPRTGMGRSVGLNLNFSD